MGQFQENRAPLLEKVTDQKQSSIRYKPLLRYIFSSFMVIAHLLSFAAYLGFKISLYIREYREVLGAPWVIVILLCECGYFLSSLMYCVELLIPPWLNSKPPFPLPQDEKDFPTVDILLPCCKEPTDVIQDTILAALALDYPPDRFKLLVLDDAADEELKIFCQSLKVETGGTHIDYLRRTKVPGVPHNFKCGNLNHGLEHSNAEYVAMLDADMILDPSFLRAVLPHIINSPSVAFVQVPQSYYNLPIGDPLNDASLSFYEKTLVQRNLLGCASCVGTGAIFRRACLDLIGGYQPQSITEDCITAYTLFNEGYRSFYLNKKLQMGLAPWNLERYLKQRERWCLGAIQQFSYTWKGMLGTRSRLDFFNKIFFVSYTGYFYLSILNILMQSVFACALAFRLNLVVGDDSETRTLVTYLAMYLVIWRLTWMVQWWEVPQQIQGRNREEAHFWWMTPFFFMTILRASFPSIFTFNFITTSSVDSNPTSSSPKKSTYKNKISKLGPLTFHLAYVCLVVSLVSWQSYNTYTRGGIRNRKELTFVAGIALYLLTTCLYMLVPVFYVVWPTTYIPSMRKSILHYKNGHPQFLESACIPKWHWPLFFYEIVSYSILIIWVGVLYIAVYEIDHMWWKD